MFMIEASAKKELTMQNFGDNNLWREHFILADAVDWPLNWIVLLLFMCRTSAAFKSSSISLFISVSSQTPCSTYALLIFTHICIQLYVSIWWTDRWISGWVDRWTNRPTSTYDLYDIMSWVIGYLIFLVIPILWEKFFAVYFWRFCLVFLCGHASNLLILCQF